MPDYKGDPTQRAAFKRPLAKALRGKATDAERILWAALRSKQLSGFRFHRQQPVGPYIADFFCASAKLVVELDGGQHGTDIAITRDATRTAFLESQGYQVLRFWNVEVFKDRQRVLEVVFRAARARSIPLKHTP